MTEDEAKTKWCPMANAVATVPPLVAPAGNRGVNNDSSIHANPPWARCIASACMAWRGRSALVHSDTGERVAPGEVVLIHKSEHRHLGDGYCGLAGQPQ